MITSLELSGENHRKSTPRFTTAGISLKSKGVVTCNITLSGHNRRHHRSKCIYVVVTNRQHSSDLLNLDLNFIVR